MSRPLLALALAALLVGCGYRCGDPNPLTCSHDTITIPYIECDFDGGVTTALIREVSASGLWRYVPCNGSLILHGQIVDQGRENIGFEFDTNDRGEEIDLIVADEGRLFRCLKFWITDGCSNCILFGPACVSVAIDYDYDPLSTNDRTAETSLGQYVQIDEAEEVALLPLYRKLARKVVDYVSLTRGGHS